MNKRNTTKLTSIALVASMAVGLSASAVAGGKGNGPKDGKGPQASLGVSTWCEIKDDNVADGVMSVYVSVEDKSSGVAFGYVQLDSVVIQGKTKDRGNLWYDIPGAVKTPDLQVGVSDQEVTINICGGDLGKAINAKTTITLDQSLYPSSKPEYTAQCSDNPMTDEVEGGLKTADFEGLCSAATP